MSRGVSAVAIARVFLLNIPFVLQFTVPMSALTTVLLLFTGCPSTARSRR